MVALPFCHVTLKGQKLLPPPRYSEDPRSLGEWLRKRRIEVGILQRELAVTLEVCERTIGRWESDQHRPSQVQMVALVRLFGEPPWEMDRLKF